MRNSIIVAALISLLACQVHAETNLEEAARDTRYAPGCERMAKLEFGQSFTLPVKTPQGLRYRLFYYPTRLEKGAGDEDWVALPAQVIAEFDLKTGEVICRRPRELPGEMGKPLGPGVPPASKGISFDAHEAEIDRLYNALERAAAGFAAGSSDAETRTAAREFRRLFNLYSEPGLASSYRSLSPEFWKWLESLDAKKKPAK